MSPERAAHALTKYATQKALELAADDHELKPDGYFSLPSVEHYLIVDPDRRVVIHHKRGTDAIETRILREGLLRLEPPGLEVEVAAFL